MVLGLDAVAKKLVKLSKMVAAPKKVENIRNGFGNVEVEAAER